MAKQQKSKSGQAAGSPTGWWNPTPYSTRGRAMFHYVAENRRSLCGNWLYIDGTLEERMDAYAHKCPACKKKKLALNAKSENKRWKN